MSLVVGIDPGLSGGLAAVLDAPEGEMFRGEAKAMPLSAEGSPDLAAIRLWLADRAPRLVVIEAVSCRPGEAGRATLTSGKNWGALVGLCVGLGLAYAVVRPQAWKDEVIPDPARSGRGRSNGKACALDKAASAAKREMDRKAQKAAGKQRAIDFCARAYPFVSLLPSERCRKPSDGMADALCIAEYGRRLHAAAQRLDATSWLD